MNPTLHLLGLPHTVTRPEFSHCAYSMKVMRFSPMLRSVGYNVIHYGNEGATSGANEQVNVLSKEEMEKYLGGYNPSGPKFVGDVADIAHPIYKEFNSRLHNILKDRVEPTDIICLPFGYGHQEAVQGLDATLLETGIGYPQTCTNFRIFESQVWYNWVIGRENKTGHDYNWVIPNYYNIAEWTVQKEKGKYLLFFGRICEPKGMQIVLEIAKHRPDLTVVLCGQGDPIPYMKYDNIEYQRPVFGAERDALLGNALAVIMPTRYVEPFGGVTVEANLTGTPVLGSSYGSFTETIDQGFTGYRCNTLGDWLAGIEQIEEWGPSHREYIASVTRTKYDMYALAHDYDNVIKQIVDLQGKGWYSFRSSIGPVTKAIAA
jgi:glycosyltransferase involved in cell wall biosynthesis